MYRILFFSILVLALFSCKKPKKETPIANNKALKWVKTYGGSGYDHINTVTQISTGEYVIAGASRSSDGDIPGIRSGYDAWLAKVDLDGKKVWSFVYGDHDEDQATGVVQAADGGFLIVGFTFVNNQNFPWIIKTDANGSLQWQKALNASSDSKPAQILSNGDATYTIVGYSTAASQDGFIAKIDASGNVVYNKTYGGSAADYFTSVLKTSDGFLVTGYTKSTDGAMTANKGNFDGWIMKLNQSGDKVWSTNYGGSDEDYLKSVASTSDGGFIVAGYTKSTNGDIPSNKGGYEEWLIKIDGNGSKQWIKTYGGLNEEYVTSIASSGDGNFVTAGYTNSTTGDVVRVNNDFGGWLIKLDGGGNKTDASTYGTDRVDDFTNALITTQDGGYIMAGYTWVEGRGYDGWLVKIDKF